MSTDEPAIPSCPRDCSHPLAPSAAPTQEVLSPIASAPGAAPAKPAEAAKSGGSVLPTLTTLAAGGLAAFFGVKWNEQVRVP